MLLCQNVNNFITKTLGLLDFDHIPSYLAIISSHVRDVPEFTNMLYEKKKQTQMIIIQFNSKFFNN